MSNTQTRYGIMIFMVLILILTTGCRKNRASESVAEEEGKSLHILASTSIIGDIVSQIAGKDTKVKTMIPQGISPHDWEASPRELIALEDADIVFVNGLGLESQLLHILENIHGPVVVELSQGVVPLMGDHDHADHDEDAGSLAENHDDHDENAGSLVENHDYEDHGEDADPHLWFSIRNVIIWTQTIANALGAIDPENALSYTHAAKGYAKQLGLLDDTIGNLTSRIPAEHRKLITDHNVLAYFAEDYGFSITGSLIPSISDQAEISAKHLSALQEVIKEEGIRAIFLSETSSKGVRKLADSVSKIGTRTLPIVSLLTGSLAPPGERGDDYEDFILYNTELIIQALSDAQSESGS